MVRIALASLIFLSATIVGGVGHVYAQYANAPKVITVKPTGVYAEIDTKKTFEAVAGLRAADVQSVTNRIKDIEANAPTYQPPVFLVLAQVLFAQGKVESAAYWYHVGWLRARYDANRCAQMTAKQAVQTMISQTSREFVLRVFGDAALIARVLPKVVKWDEEAPYSYDHRWINLHGSESAMSGVIPISGAPPVLSLPESDWPAIAKKTREDFVRDVENLARNVQSLQPVAK